MSSGVTWRIEYAWSVRKELKKIDPATRRRIRSYLEDGVAQLENPRQRGKRLKGQLSDLWRYRIGDYRVVCQLRDETLVVLVLRVGHRREVYR